MGLFKKLPDVTRNYVADNRRWVAVKRHIPVLLQPLAASASMMALWRLFLHPQDIHFGELAREPIMFVILAPGIIIYGIVAGVAMQAVCGKHGEISRSVVRRDKDAFLVLRDEKLPIVMHLLLGASSVVIIGYVLLLDYQGDGWSGMIAAGGLTFLLTLIWVVVTEFDDFRNGIWFQKKVPEDWYSINVEEYFNGKSESSEETAA